MGNHKVISETWKGKGTAAPLAQALNAIGGVLNNVESGDGINAYVRNGRLVIELTGGGSDVDFSLFCFGFTIAGATVTIKGGEMQWGVNDPSIMEDAGPIPLTADYQYIGIEFDRDSRSIVTIGPDANASLFRSDSQKFRTWLHQFRLVSGKASLHRIGHLGNFDITGWFGA
jgi:hypothetical protein